MGTADRTTRAGLLVVGAAAAVMSFSALAGLAHAAGVTAHTNLFTLGWLPLRLSWLLPVAVDAYAATSTRIWLRAGIPVKVRDWARANALAAITVSVAGNIAYHELPTVPLMWVTVAVAAVPPLMLGAVVHTAVLVCVPPAPKPGRVPTRSPAVSPPSRLALVPPTAGTAGTLKARMRAHWDTERAAGRTPTAADLDRAAGTRGYGKKLRPQFLAADTPAVTP